MRKPAVAVLVAVLTAGSLAAGMATEAGASVRAKKASAPLCAGKTKKKAIAGATAAYKGLFEGTTVAEKENSVQLLSGKTVNAAFKAQFEASAAKNAAAASTTKVAIDKVTCTGKKTAEVVFTLVIGGKRLEGLFGPGGAILEKTWKMTGVTLCNVQAGGDPGVIDREPCLSIINNG